MLARTPLAATCTVRETREMNPSHLSYRGGNYEIHIEGPSVDAVRAAIADYKLEHAACEPSPAFYYIQNYDGKFVVAGSRGEDPRK